MIQTLKIKNVALISEATLQFDEKLNVISGETGAGKSIMLDSLSFVFGGRADRSLIRTGESSMKVEVIFTCLKQKHIDYIQKELGIDCGDELFLSRELDVNGKNTCKINGELVPVAMVKKICLTLVDVHGQSEHLAILNNDYQLQIIDMFSKNAESILRELSAEIEEIKDLERQLKDLGGSEAEKQNLIDLYSYQIQEIENAGIKENEYEDLIAEKKAMQQFEKINESLKTAKEKLSVGGFDESVLDKVNSANKSILSIAELNVKFSEIAERLNSVWIEIDDLSSAIVDELKNNVFDQERFDYVDDRLDLIKNLFRKYGGNFENLNNYFISIKEKLNNLINSAEKYCEITEKINKKLNFIENIQIKLSEERKKSANILKGKIQDELRTLGMPNAMVDINFSRINERFSSVGFDRVEFMFSSNVGFDLQPLNKVVSGGEMSRVMLAYKIVVSQIDDIQTIVFDEIDTGLSGNIATVVAQYMARLSLNKQIIAVSHLPQICAMADTNIRVSKSSMDGTTKTNAEVLVGELLLKEIARLMGATDGKTGLLVSSDLKEASNMYKNKLQ